MHHFLEMTDQGQHRQDRFDNHPVIPLTAPAEFEIGRLPIGLHEAIIRQDDHELGLPLNQVLKTAPVVHIGCITRPIDNQAEMVQDKTQFAADNPAPVRHPFASDLLRTAPLAARMNQFDTPESTGKLSGRS